MGRPTKYSDKIGTLICEEMASGKTLRQICKAEGMPGRSTVHFWLISSDPKFSTLREQYAQARACLVEFWADEIVQIADASDKDTIIKEGRDGEEYEVQNHEWMNRSRLRVDTRKWLMSKLSPTKYGERSLQEIEVKPTSAIFVDAPPTETREEWEARVLKRNL